MKKGIYEESGWVAEVNVLEDLSDEEWEKYTLEVIKTLQESPIFGAQAEGQQFEVSAQRKYRAYVDWRLEIQRVMTKIEALNSLPVTDYSLTAGECEYVLTYNNEKVKRHLMDAGFTEDEIKEASDESDSDIDLSCLAFNYTEANWWKVDGGFVSEKDIESDRTT